MGALVMAGDVETNPGPTGTRSHTEQAKTKDKQAVLTFSDTSKPNFAEMMQEIRDLRQDLSSRIDGLGVKMDKNYTEMQGEIATLKEELEISRKDNEDMKRKIDDLENRSRRDNIVVHGICEATGEKWDDTEKKLCKTLSEKLSISVNADSFQRVHRIGKWNKKGRPIVALCTSYKTKTAIMNAAKDVKPKGLYVNEDYSPMVRSARQQLNPLRKLNRERGCTTYLSFDKLIVKNTAEGILSVYKYDAQMKTVVKIKETLIEPSPHTDEDGASRSPWGSPSRAGLQEQQPGISRESMAAATAEGGGPSHTEDLRDKELSAEQE